mgnify:CR=1 FL=1
MKKKFQEKNDIKLLSKQRVLFRAFVVNTVLVLLIWALTFIPSLMYFGVLITGVSAPMFYVYAVGTLALWGLAGVIFFLVPGIAIWWERKMMK